MPPDISTLPELWIVIHEATAGALSEVVEIVTLPAAVMSAGHVRVVLTEVMVTLPALAMFSCELPLTAGPPVALIVMSPQ